MLTWPMGWNGIGGSMTKFQKVGIAVAAFCLTVAVTRRVQQELDKEAFAKLQQARTKSLTEGLWE